MHYRLLSLKVLSYFRQVDPLSDSGSDTKRSKIGYLALIFAMILMIALRIEYPNSFQVALKDRRAVAPNSSDFGLTGILSELDCSGPYVWDTSSRREGFGSNFGRRTTSIKLANLLNAKWIGVVPNSHGGMDGAQFLGLTSARCSPDTIAKQIDMKLLHTYEIDLYGLFGNGSDCSAFKNTSSNFFMKAFTDFHENKSMVLMYTENDDKKRNGLRRTIARCTSTPLITPAMRSRYEHMKNQRGRLKLQDEFRISLYFRWGDVGRNANLSDTRTYNKRTGKTKLSKLGKYQRFIGDVLKLVDQSDWSSPYNLTFHIFSEGNATEFRDALSSAASDSILHIGGTYEEAFDELTLSNIILAGTKHETFVQLAAMWCSQCKLIDGPDIDRLIEQWDITG